MWRRSDSVSGDHFECPNRAVLLDKVWDASRRLWLFGGVALLALDAALGSRLPGSLGRTLWSLRLHAGFQEL
jgi:hypothetical protein